MRVRSGKRFRQIYIEVTNVCNLSCSFCPGTVRESGFMQRDIFERCVKEAAPLADQVYLHVMGEPLLHPEIGQFVSFCGSVNLPVSVTTNGALLEERGDVLLDPAVRQVNISLHAHDAAFTESRILPFVLRAAETSPELYINLRLWDLESFEGASSADAVALLERVFGASVPRNASAHRKGEVLRGRIYLHRDTVFSWPGEAQPSGRGFCHGLGTHCAILCDGTVVPCCLDRDGELALGNIARTSLREIIASPRAAAMKAGFDRGELVEDLCRRCSFCRRFDAKKGTMDKN